MTNPVTNCTLIIRSQAEYSPTASRLNVRFMLEMPTTGQHRGFVDVEDLVTALRIELEEWMELYHSSQREKNHKFIDDRKPASGFPSLIK